MFGFEGMTFRDKAVRKTEGFSVADEVQCIFLDSSMVEHSAVNRVVVGSSPTRGATKRSFSKM